MLSDKPGNVVLPLCVVDVAILRNVVGQTEDKKVQPTRAGEAGCRRTIRDVVFHASTISTFEADVLAGITQARLVHQ